MSEPWKKTYAASEAGPWQKTYSGAKSPQSTAPAWQSIARTLTNALPPGLNIAARAAVEMFPRQAQGVAQSFAQQATLGGSDEIVSAVLSAPAAVRGGLPAARQSFTQAQRDQKASREDFARRNPVLNTAATGAGMATSLALPATAAGRFVAAAPTVGTAALRSGGVGAGTGALQGFLAADEGNRLAGAVLGAGGGLVLGAAAPYAVSMAGELARRARGLFPGAPQVGPVTPAGAPIPRGQLASQMKTAQALQRAIDRDSAMGITFEPGQNPLYRGGPNLVGVYEAAAQHPGSAQAAIQRAAAKGQSDIAEGVAADVGRALNAKGDFFSYQNNLIETQRKNARSGMERLGNQLVTLDENSVLALRSDGARSALMKAAGNMRMSIDPDVRSQANDLVQVLDRVLDKPSGATITVRDSQNITEKLLTAADQAFRAGDNDTGIALKGLGRAIRDNSRDPSRGGFADYDQWLRQYGLDADNRKALDLGKDVLNPEWPERVQMDLAEMEPSALAHYQKGVGEAVRNAIRKPNGEVATMRKLLRDRNIQDKLRLAFPDDESFETFLQAAEQRVSDAERNAVLLQGSRSALRRATQEDLESGGKGIMQLLSAGLEGLLSPQSIPGNAARGALKAFPKNARGVLSDPVASEALGRTALEPEELTRLLQLLKSQNTIVPRPGAPNPFSFLAPPPPASVGARP